MGPSEEAPARVVGQYELYGVMSRGAMATLHYGRLVGPAGFARAVAVKQLHPELTARPEFVAALTDEARLASKVQHPNVVSILDIVQEKDELFLVLEYVKGETLAQLLRAAVAARMPCLLPSRRHRLRAPLRAPRRARGAAPRTGPLDIVHRDVSPSNVLVGIDGAARVFDFGTTRALERLGLARPGPTTKAYRAPEQLQGQEITRRVDVFAASVVLWETLTGRRLFEGRTDDDVANAVLTDEIEAPSEFASTVTLDLAALGGIPSHSTEAVDAVVLRGLSREPGARFATAKEMAVALEQALPPAPPSAIGEWVASRAHAALEERSAILARLDTNVSVALVLPALPGPDALLEPPTKPHPVDELLGGALLADAPAAPAPSRPGAPSRPPVDRVYQVAVTVGVIALLIAVASLLHLGWTLLERPLPD